MAGNIKSRDIQRLNKTLTKPVILFGGAALPFYGLDRGTVDIDLEMSQGTYDDIVELDKKLALLNIGGDITADANGWGIVPLPEGYRDRALATDYLNIKVLEPVDFIVSKLRRGTEIDIEDCLEVARVKEVTVEQVKKRLKKVKLPADPASFQFNRISETFLEKLNTKKKKPSRRLLRLQQNKSKDDSENER